MSGATDLQPRIDDLTVQAKQLGQILQGKLDELKLLQAEQATLGPTPEQRRAKFRLVTS